MTISTRTLEVGDATITYDVRGPLPSPDGRPPLLMIGQPMTAEGFGTLADLMSERTVVTPDPRGLGRSTRRDGSAANDPTLQAEDLHRLIAELGGPVDIFASSGGAITGLALVAAHPDDVATLVAHEPPLLTVLPDAAGARAAEAALQAAYQERGQHHGMAGFIGLTSWPGAFDDAYAARPPADPAAFGMPTEDDGSRDDPLLSGASNAVTAYEPDWSALRAASTRIVIAVGVETGEVLTGRTSKVAAAELGQEPTVFPSHHGGFLGGEHGYAGQPEAFAVRLRDVLSD